MKVIYLIGGICNGKSTLASVAESDGFYVIDLDDMSQGVLQDPRVLDALCSLDDADFIKDGKINRDFLSEYIFSSRVATHKFDRVLYPFVKEKLDKKLSELDSDSNVLVEYSGYFGESKGQDIFLKDADVVIWVESNLRDKLSRGEKRGIRPFDLTWRMRVQPFDEEYEAVADYVIHNDSTKEVLVERFRDIWSSCC